jgi:TfoX/Sxy family transcriptional regulator of competence genes
MASDPGLVKRLSDVLSAYPDLEARRMFGGTCFMLNGNMCIGVHNQNLIIRVGQTNANAIMKEPHVRPMDLTGRVMKGWATVLPEGVLRDADLLAYAKLAYEFVGTPPRK